MWRAVTDGLGADPIEKAEHLTGEWAIRTLALALAVTPLRRLTGQGWLQLYRRPLGLFAFFYATLHVAVWVGLDLALDLGDVVGEIVKRPYLTVGMLAFTILLSLAATSTTGWIRRLGSARWQRLHRLVYVAALAALVHYTWSQKKDITEPLLWSGAIGALLAARWLPARRRPSAP